MLLGVDVGSTTIKSVLLGEPGGAPIHTSYARHRGDPRAAAGAALAPLAGLAARVFVTGSSAGLLAERWGALVVHEVSAVAAAVARRWPAVRTVVELGGQDAKLIVREPDGPLEVAMNDRCAAGTGATIDRCLHRLGIAAEVAARVRLDAAQVRALSTKCGVFAETDLVNLARRGVPADVLVMSLCDAIVAQTRAVLARGRTLATPLLLLGGPHAYLPALADAWRRVLGDDVHVPPHALWFAALGACELGSEREGRAGGAAIAVDVLRARLATAGAPVAVRLDRPLAPPSPSPSPSPSRASPSVADARASGTLAIGVDAGSTASKAVAIDGSGAVVARARRPSGEPIADARALVDELAAQVLATGARFDVGAVGVTGYGGPLLAAVLAADVEVVETVAHAAAARAACADVEVVCDVGGQDIKILRLDAGGAVRDFWLSSQCSAGIGALLEVIAGDLGCDRASYAERAFAAARAPWFGDACTVFLDSSRVGFQRQGFGPDEILAGLARAVPRIVWSQVTNGVAPASLGRRFVLQGGVHCNPAVIAAQRDFLAAAVPGAEVVVHPDAAFAGAVGAATLARTARTARTGDERPRPLAIAPTITITSDDRTRCDLCASNCPRSRVEVHVPGAAPEVHVTGGGCIEGAVPSPPTPTARAAARARKRAIPDLLAEEARLLFRRPRVARPRLTVGVPRVLAMYRSAPFFTALLAALDVGVVFSPPTSERLWRAGASHGASDPCFPVKVVHAHVHHLLHQVHDRGRRLDAIFLPHVTHAVIPVRHVADSASCPVVAASPSLVRAAFAGELADRGLPLLDPFITLTDRARLAAQVHAALGPLCAVDRRATDAAVAAGLAAQAAVRDELLARGAAILAGVATGRWPAAVLVLARPYHVDPGLNHQLGAELAALGLPSLSIAALPRDEAALAPSFAADVARGVLADPFDIRDLLPGCANSGAAERVWAARVAARHGRIAVVDLSSFKCGQDSPTYAPVRAVLEAAGTPALALHELDETRPVTSLRVRLRTFARALAERGMLP